MCNSFVILRSGFLLGASEFSDHGFYRFKSIGDADEDEVVGHIAVQEQQVPLIKVRAQNDLKNLLWFRVLTALLQLLT